MGKLIEQVSVEAGLPLLHPGLNDAKIAAADKILEGVRRGENQAIAAFKTHMGANLGESISTTGDDFTWAFAQLTAVAVKDEYEADERNWTEAIEEESFSSFETPKEYRIDSVVSGFSRPANEDGKPGHIVPIVPEGSPYPGFQFSGEVVTSGSLHKAGGRYDLTFEKIVSDVAGLVPKIPTLITDSLLDRREYDAWAGLIAFIDQSANHLTAGTSLDGTSFVADAPLSQASLAGALSQAKNREIRGRKVKVSGYNLLVPVGAGDAANFIINTLSLVGMDIQDGSRTNRLNVSSYNPFSSLRGVIETEYLDGSQWALIPAKGAIARNAPSFYKYGKLIGHEGIDLRVQNLTGLALGGGAIPPFSGSYDSDSASFRGRIIGGGVGWESAYAVISDGS